MKYFYGPKKKKNYFEGWYFKHTSKELNIAFIPSISIVNFKEKKSFIQVICDSFTERFEFPYSDFSAETKILNVKIKNNIFSSFGLNLNLKNEHYEIQVDLRYSAFLILSSDIMGPFKNLPQMECKHNIFSMKHFVNGIIKINGQKYFFENDLGYIEGDYGTSFPNKYLWIQSNDLDRGSFFLSIATIPYGKIHFTGLISSLFIGSKEYRFSTYNFTKIIRNTNQHVQLKKGKFTLDVYMYDSNKFNLSAPKNGDMSRTVSESMRATITIILSKNNQEIYRETANNASIEFG